LAGRESQPPILSYSGIEGIVLLNNFLNREKSVGSIVILNLDGDIGNSARLFAAI
jgi:hypothetical protein